MRQQALDSYSHKFDGPFTAWLYDRSMTGCDAETGESDSFGWYGLMGRNILVVDSQGFVDRTRFASATAAREAFDDIDREYREHWEE